MKVRDRFIDLDRYVFTFGKNKGRLIQDVIEDEAHYVLWCHENIDWFNLSDIDFDEVYAEAQRQGNESSIWDWGEHDDWGDRY